MQKQEQPPSKRKAASEMDGNPLANAAKRTKKDAKNASKRKLLANAEPTRSGLFIVRESSFSQPESNSRESSAAQQPSSSLPLKRNASSDLPQPPSKKARAESQPPSTLKTKSTAPRPSPAQQPRQTHRSGSLPPANGRLAAHHTNGFASIAEEDERIEDDVRAMDAEADRLRRSSRVYLPESSSTSSTSIITFNPGQERPRARSRSRGRVISMDTVQAVPVDESPQIERNKRLREGAMNAIAATNGDASHAETSRRGREREREPSTANGHHRRKSSLSGRGKRISTSFEVGVIPQPHNSVSDASFYKHIDADLPDAERLRTLLIWCASRAAAKPSAPLSKPDSGASDNGKGKDNPPPAPDLPPLSARAQEFLKNTQEDVIRMLAERRIDLSLFSGDDPLPSRGEVPLKPNEQNVTNRILEVRYAEQIKRAQEEEEAWKRLSYHYDAFSKRQKEFLEKRIARMAPKDPPSDDTPVDESQPATPSAKAKGKQRDMGIDDSWKAINEHDLPQDMRRGVRIARALIHSVQPKPPSSSGKSPSPKRQKRSSSTPLPLPTPSLPDGELDLIGQALDDEVERRMHSVEFKLEYLLSCAHAARSMVYVAEELLNRWFELLNHNLASRTHIQLPSTSSSSSSSAPGRTSSAPAASDPSVVGGFLAKYVPRRLPPAGFAITGYEDANDPPLPPPSSSSSASRIPPPSSSGLDPQDLFRALSLVDRKRPPGMVGDAARRAARDVARAGESGIGVIGERPVQKVPTTPRRGDRTIRRDRTPAR